MRAATALPSLLERARVAPSPASDAASDLQLDTSAACVSSGFDDLDRNLPGCGWPAGQLIDLLCESPGADDELLAPVIAWAARRRLGCVWIAPCRTGIGAVDSIAIGARGPAARPGTALDFAHCVRLEPVTPREGSWAFEHALRSDRVAVVIGWLPSAGSDAADFRAARRLHLLARGHGALAFALRAADRENAASPAALRLKVARRDDALQVSILKAGAQRLLRARSLRLPLRPPDEAAAEAQRAKAPVLRFEARFGGSASALALAA